MELNIERDNLGKVEVKSYGLSFSVNPIAIWKQTLSESEQKLIDEMILTKFKKVIFDITSFYINIYPDFDEHTKSQVDDKSVVVDCVLNYANFMRSILPLSSDSDAIYEDTYASCDKASKESMDWALSMYRYSTPYGYKESVDKIVEL